MKYLRTNKALAVILLAGVTAAVLSMPFASAAGPSFNIFPISYDGQPNTDLPFIDAKNVTKGEGWSASQGDHDAGIQADPGDIIEFSVYYHNGTPDIDENVAMSTVIKAFSSPGLGTAQQNHRVAATVEADNAPLVGSDDSARGGSIAIAVSGATAQSLSLVPGSTVLRFNFGQGNNPQTMPDSIFSGGINIGDVRGCFQYHGFVNFRLQVSQDQPPAGDFSITKEVRNVSIDSGFDASEVTASSGQTVEFKVTISTSDTASDMRASDIMDNRLSFTGNINRSSGGSLNPSEFFTSTGTSLGSLAPGNSEVITYQAQVTSFFTSQNTVLGNTAFASNGTTTKDDQAQVRVATVQPPPPPPQAGTLQIRKEVRNVAQNIGFSDTQVNVRVGDIVEYRITVSASNNSVGNVGVSDALDSNLALQGPVTLDGGQQIPSSQFFGPTFNIGTVTPGQSRVIVFQATVNSSVVAGQSYANLATAQAGADMVQDDAFVAVQGALPPPLPPGTRDLTIAKRVRNIDTATNFGSSVNAEPGQLVRFEIVTSSTGTASQTNVVLRDTISDGRLTFVPGSMVIDAVAQSGDQNIFGSGKNFGTEAPNAAHTILFDARVGPASSFPGGATITNAARVVSSEVAEKTATATVTVTVGPPPPPGTRDFTIVKQVRNVTDAGGFAVSAPADPGDHVEFRVTLNTTGTASQTNFTVRDVIGDSRLNYTAGSLSLNGAPAIAAQESAFFAGGLNLGTLPAGSNHVLTFMTNVTGIFPAGATILSNNAFAQSSEVAQKSSQASVTVTAAVITPIRDIAIEKRVLNASRGQTNFAESATASDGETVRFEIVISTSGNASQTAVIVRDTLPSRLTFVSGDQLIGGGINLGTLPAGTTRTFTFNARVTGVSSATVVNTAFVRSAEVIEGFNDAVVFISGSGGSVDFRELNITKRVQNITAGGSYAGSASANPGDRVRFEIRIETLGNVSQNNVMVRDVLPSRLNFTSGESDLFGSSGRNLGTLAAGTVRSFTYEAIIANADQFSSGVTTLANRASVRSDQISERTAIAQVFVTRSISVGSVQPQQRKTAFNITRNANATQVIANPGDVINYTLYFRNAGTANAAGVIIEDNISDVLELADMADQSGAVLSGSIIRWAPVDVSAGIEVTRTFRVRVKNSSLFPANSDLVMSNIYGNEIRVPVVRFIPAVLGTTAITPAAIPGPPPRTGPTEWIIFGFSSIATGGFWVLSKLRKRAKLLC